LSVTGQLIDASSGMHVRASERYDRRTEDIFSLQDEIALSVVGAIAPSIAVVALCAILGGCAIQRSQVAQEAKLVP
jgi:hypothetical protein